MSLEIDRPHRLLPEQLDAICQLIYDAFSNHAVLPNELNEWSPAGVASDLGGLFIRIAARGGLVLARRSSTDVQSGGEVVGLVAVRQPKSAPAPVDSASGDEGRYVTEPPGPPPETPELKRRKEWRESVLEPFTSNLFESAFGKFPSPDCHITFIAVAPTSQKTGVGKALIQAAEKLADGLGVGMTLMTDTSANMGWYTSLGYSVGATDELEVAGQTVRFWAMSKGVTGKS